MKALMKRDGDNPHSLSIRLRKRVTQPQIHRYLSGISREPRRSTLQPIAEHYGVAIDAFYDAAVARSEAVRLGLAKGSAEPPLPTYFVTSQAEQTLLASWRAMDEEDRIELADEVHKRAARASARLARFLESLGVDLDDPVAARRAYERALELSKPSVTLPPKAGVG